MVTPEAVGESMDVDSPGTVEESTQPSMVEEVLGGEPEGPPAEHPRRKYRSRTPDREWDEASEGEPLPLPQSP